MLSVDALRPLRAVPETVLRDGRQFFGTRPPQDTHKVEDPYHSDSITKGPSVILSPYPQDKSPRRAIFVCLFVSFITIYLCFYSLASLL